MARSTIILALVALLVAQAAADSQRRLLKKCPKNCARCSSSNDCDRCEDGYKWMGDETKACQPLPPDPRPDQKTIKIDIPPRIQYLLKDGYCAEAAFQSAALLSGQWIPQVWLRETVAKRAFLSGDTMSEAKRHTDDALRKMRIKFDGFDGKGWQQFMGWAKGFLVKRTPVVTVAFLPGEHDDRYDHAEVLIGITTATPGSAKYDASDIFLFNTVMDKYNQPIRRLASEFHGTRTSCIAPDDVGGCIPDDVEAGWAVLGATYDGIGPHVELRIPKHPEEPTVRGTDIIADSEEWDGEVVLSGLEAGKTYTLYKFTSLDGVPKTPSDRINPSAADWSKKITAQGRTASVRVTFTSSEPAYFIAV